MTCGAGWSVRERGEEGVGLVRGGLGRLVFPGAAQVGSWLLSFIFFFLLSFSFICDFCFDNLKRLLYSELNKIKADHFWSLKSVFRNHKPEV
jgi:hypothetical protein